MKRGHSLSKRLRNALDFRLGALFFGIRNRLSPPEGKVREAGIQLGWRVLDYGCGIGGHSIAAARLVGPEGKVYAADCLPPAVEYVMSLGNRLGLNNLEGIVTDCDTALDSESIDAVLLYDVFHDLDQPERVLAELVRVLKPEGCLSFSDHHMTEADALSRLTAGGVFRLGSRGKLTHTFRRSRGRQ